MFGFISLLSDNRKGEDQEDENNERLLRSSYAIFRNDGLQICTTDISLSLSNWLNSSFYEMVS